MDDASLYDTDIVAWAEEQSRAVRELAGRPGLTNALDWENIAEEIESLGRSYVDSVESKIMLVLVHLMKVVSAPTSPAVKGWKAEITSFQRVVRKQYAPSMRQKLDVDEIWSDAMRDAKNALTAWGDVMLRELPDRSPFTLQELISRDFEVEDALDRMSRAVLPAGDA